MAKSSLKKTITMSKTIINLPKSARIVTKFKQLFPTATFYGATALGSGRKSYLLTTEIAESASAKEILKRIGCTIPKHQPFRT